ncbi:MAG: 2-dehydropantoate 2-reductase [Gammaproteobacteria bacterium]|nr:2-dehydropantoate 2-reductase [Gammaproteobacteria bacterium]
MESIAMVGVGAIGGAVAAALGDIGRSVTLCVRTPFAKLERTLDGKVITYEHLVLTDPATANPVDWLLICTKAHQTQGAAPWFERLIDSKTRVAVLQNGVDHVERLRRFIGKNPIVPVIIMLPAVATAPGKLRQGRPGTLKVPDSEAGREFAQLFSESDTAKVNLSDDFLSIAWSKLVHNAAGGAVCALALRENGVVAEPSMRGLIVALMREIIAVGRAEGADLSDDLPDEIIARHANELRDHWTSIAVDRREGRRMEWEARNAVVGRIGRLHGIPTPLNDALTALLAAVDEGLG